MRGGSRKGKTMTGVLTRPSPSELGTTPSRHPLTGILHRAARRSLPPGNGTVAVCPAPAGPCDAVLALPGYAVVAADVPVGWVLEQVPPGDGGAGAVSAGFLSALADRLGVPAPGLNILLAARKPPQAGARVGLRPSDRIPTRWAAYRSDVTCYADVEGAGVITIGHGPGRRLDLSVELDGAERSWLRADTLVQGRELLEAARTVAEGDLFASVPAWDAPTLRTYLCGGFRAIGAEALFLTRPAPATPTWFP